MARYATVIGFGVLVRLNMVIIWNNAETTRGKSTHMANTLMAFAPILCEYLPLTAIRIRRNCFVIRRILNRHFIGFNLFYVVEN